MDFSLIAFDLDGTALQEDHASFSPRLKAALLESYRRGVSVIPVTGRQYELLPPAIGHGEEWENLAVLCNGGEVRRLADGSVLCSHYLSKAALVSMIAGAKRLGVPIELSSGGTLYLTRDDWEKERIIGGGSFHVETVLPRNGRTVDDLSVFCQEFAGHFEKVNLPFIPDDSREATESMLGDLPVSAVWSSMRGIEVTDLEATKANGLLTACRLLGIDISKALAIGDGGNDVSMLRESGFGVAMGNAPDFVRAAANAVTDPFDEDGAAIAIERYVLGIGV